MCWLSCQEYSEVERNCGDLHNKAAEMVNISHWLPANYRQVAVVDSVITDETITFSWCSNWDRNAEIYRVSVTCRWMSHMSLLLLWILQASGGSLLIVDGCYSSSAQSLVATLLPITLAETQQGYCTEGQAHRQNHSRGDYLWWRRKEDELKPLREEDQELVNVGWNYKSFLCFLIR